MSSCALLIGMISFGLGLGRACSSGQAANNPAKKYVGLKLIKRVGCL